MSQSAAYAPPVIHRAQGKPKNKNPRTFSRAGVFLQHKSLTMTYFHRRTSTIIGAKAFHVPVRDGKEWDHLAMVVKRNRVSWGLWACRCWAPPWPHDQSGKKHRCAGLGGRDSVEIFMGSSGQYGPRWCCVFGLEHDFDFHLFERYLNT